MIKENPIMGIIYDEIFVPIADFIILPCWLRELWHSVMYLGLVILYDYYI